MHRMRKKINELIEYLFLSHGIDLSGFDNAFIEKTVERRLDGHHGFTINDYVSFLKANEEEVIHLVDSMHISYSEFFRNPLPFSCLEMLVLPLLWTKKKYDMFKCMKMMKAEFCGKHSSSSTRKNNSRNLAKSMELNSEPNKPVSVGMFLFSLNFLNKIK